MARDDPLLKGPTEPNCTRRSTTPNTNPASIKTASRTDIPLSRTRQRWLLMGALAAELSALHGVRMMAVAVDLDAFAGITDEAPQQPKQHADHEDDSLLYS